MLRGSNVAPHVIGLFPFISVLDALLGTPLLLIAQAYLASWLIRSKKFNLVGFYVPMALILVLFGLGLIIGAVLRNNDLFFDDARFLLYYPLLIPSFYLAASQRSSATILLRYCFYVSAILLVVINAVYIVLFEANAILFLTALGSVSTDLAGMVAMGDGFVLPGLLVFCLLVYMVGSFDDDSLSAKAKALFIFGLSLYVSSISLLVVAVLYFVALYWRRGARVGKQHILLLLLVLIVTIAMVVVLFIPLDPSREEASLSNRFRQAEFLIRESMDSPFFGHGFGYFSPDYIVSPTKPYLYELDFLSLLMKSGIVGSLLYLVANYLLMRYSVPAPYRPNHQRILLVFFIAMTNGGFYTSFLFVYLVGAFILYENKKGGFSSQPERLLGGSSSVARSGSDGD